jgi:hypothetical protein
MAKELDRIGFLIHDREPFHHYANVWRHMPAGSVEVLVAATKATFDGIVEACGRYELPWRDAEQMFKDKLRFTTVVSSFPVLKQDGLYVPPERNRDIARYSLRFMYGNGKAGWNFSEWNKIYDTILCFGPYQAKGLAFCDQTLKVQMGYPRFDRFFNEPIDRVQRLQELGLDPTRKTVVWLPTWSNLSSIDVYAPAIALLQKDYNVIVKPHPLTLSTEEERMQKLAPFSCVIRESIDNVVLFQLADLLLCDYGGSAFGAIYTDRNVVLLDLPNAEADSMTGQDSSDIELRKHIAHVQADEADGLGLFLTEHAASYWAEQPRARAKLREEHFAPYYGYASQVAALAILNAPLAHASSAAELLDGAPDSLGV